MMGEPDNLDDELLDNPLIIDEGGDSSATDTEKTFTEKNKTKQLDTIPPFRSGEVEQRNETNKGLKTVTFALKNSAHVEVNKKVPEGVKIIQIRNLKEGCSRINLGTKNHCGNLNSFLICVGKKPVDSLQKKFTIVKTHQVGGYPNHTQKLVNQTLGMHAGKTTQIYAYSTIPASSNAHQVGEIQNNAEKTGNQKLQINAQGTMQVNANSIIPGSQNAYKCICITDADSSNVSQQYGSTLQPELGCNRINEEVPAERRKMTQLNDFCLPVKVLPVHPEIHPEKFVYNIVNCNESSVNCSSNAVNQANKTCIYSNQLLSNAVASRLNNVTTNTEGESVTEDEANDKCVTSQSTVSTDLDAINAPEMIEIVNLEPDLVPGVDSEVDSVTNSAGDNIEIDTVEPAEKKTSVEVENELSVNDVCVITSDSDTDEGNASKTNPLADYNSDVPEIKAFVCQGCWAVFENPDSLEEHHCPSTNADFSLRMAEKSHFTCGHCGKEFKERFLVKRHLKSHTGVKEFLCDLCDKSFLLKHHLINHIEYHFSNRPFKCQVCGASFKRKPHLVKHSLSHSVNRERKYQCQHCDKAFFMLDKLQRHERTHIPDRQRYVCEICQLQYTQLGTLNKHMKNAHSSGDDYHAKKMKKVLRCKFCDAEYFLRKQMSIHLTSHDVFIDQDEEIENYTRKNINHGKDKKGKETDTGIRSAISLRKKSHKAKSHRKK